jgi:Domain of unknown function (DUF4328)
MSPGMCVGAFFVPVANLVLPYRAVSELAAASAAVDGRSPTRGGLHQRARGPPTAGTPPPAAGAAESTLLPYGVKPMSLIEKSQAIAPLDVKLRPISVCVSRDAFGAPQPAALSWDHLNVYVLGVLVRSVMSTA